MANFSAIRTSSANDPARIFCMTLLRWILTVNSDGACGGFAANFGF